MRESEVMELVQAGKVRTVEVRPHAEGRHAWAVYVNGEPLGSARLDVRGFASVDTAGEVLSTLGIEVSGWRAMVGEPDKKPARKRKR